jgi:hypothetical protein
MCRGIEACLSMPLSAASIALGQASGPIILFHEGWHCSLLPYTTVQEWSGTSKAVPMVKKAPVRGQVGRPAAAEWTASQREWQPALVLLQAAEHYTRLHMQMEAPDEQAHNSREATAQGLHESLEKLCGTLLVEIKVRLTVIWVGCMHLEVIAG